MQFSFEIARAFSALAFIFYGVLCLHSEQMKSEFKRYELSQFRILTGCLEVLGGLGLVAGLFYNPLSWLSSGGLALLMFFGLVVRIRIKDKFSQMLPALLLLSLNLFIFWIALEVVL